MELKKIVAVRVLSDKDQQTVNRKLYDAVCRQDLPVVKEAIRQGAELNVFHTESRLIGLYQSHPKSPLQKAIKNKWGAGVTELLKVGATPDLVSPMGRTALWYALDKYDIFSLQASPEQISRYDIVFPDAEALIKSGANLALNFFYVRKLDDTAENSAVAEYLKIKGAKIEDALYYALKYGAENSDKKDAWTAAIGITQREDQCNVEVAIDRLTEEGISIDSDQLPRELQRER